ncbi:MAG: hypothetical protein FWE62_05450, partial [Firmicutes bacterium]|nr:hypothetical protein [Bacillota bacterium]
PVYAPHPGSMSAVERLVADPKFPSDSIAENPPPAAPVSESYADTADGAGKYYNIGAYVKTVYDARTDQFAVLRAASVDVYSADFSTKRTLTFAAAPYCMDADEGLLAVGFDSEKQIHLYDLETCAEQRKIYTAIWVSDLVMDGSIVVYADSDQWCTIVFLDLNTGVAKSAGGVYRPHLTINRDDHILYVSETGISSPDINYYNVRTGTQIYGSVIYRFGSRYNYDWPVYDGVAVHHLGMTLNKYNGDLISVAGLNRAYSGLSGFKPYRTVFDSADFALVYGTGLAGHEVAVYDNAAGEYFYSFEYNTLAAFPIGDRVFCANRARNHIAVVDKTLMGRDTARNTAYAPPELSAADGILTLSEDFTASAFDGAYLYLIDGLTFRLYVYDIDTLQNVYYERFLFKPVCLDAADGMLAVGFSEGRCFKVYDTADWSGKTVAAAVSVCQIVVWNGLVSYAEYDQWCGLYIYDAAKAAHVQDEYAYWGSLYYPTLALNRKDGILYVGSRNISICGLMYIDLATREVLFDSAQTPVRYASNDRKTLFDGGFVHYFGYVFDKTSGAEVAASNASRDYNAPGYSDIFTLYDDGTGSVFAAAKGSGLYTVLYDLADGEIVCTVEGVYPHIYRTADGLLLINDAENALRMF